MAVIKANGADFYYEVHGDGHPMMLISGYTGDSRMWLSVLEGLSKKYQVIIFDNRAVGKTKDQGLPFTLETMAEDVMALSDVLGLAKPHIVGHSMGGSVAQLVAAKYPEKINKLGIISSSSKWREAMLLSCDALFDMRKQNIDFDIIFKTNLARVYGEKFIKDDNKVALLKKIVRENFNAQAIPDQQRQLNALRDFDSRSLLDKITATTLLISGSQDIIALPEEIFFIADQIRDAHLVRLECGHNPLAELPKDVEQALIQFF